MSGAECESEMDCSDSDCGDTGYEDYYSTQPWDNETENHIDYNPQHRDPEYAVYECLRVDEVERLLNENVEVLSTNLQITPSLAKLYLHAHDWALQDILVKYQNNASNIINDSCIKLVQTIESSFHSNFHRSNICLVCLSSLPTDRFSNLSCGHSFCKECWGTHFETQISQGISTGISCMANDCNILAPEDFVLSILTKPIMRERYQQFVFRDYVKSHPQLRFCPGPNCQIVIRSKELCAKRVICNVCKTVFCFRCGMNYHAPTDCNTIKKWLTKCADDSETANYISAHTKDCPKCHICIEKNGGCNHMQCYNCKHEFCWMCLGDWKTHGSEYYECSRYKENPNIAHESVHAQAREALKKYLHYYERWENHSKSLKLEEQTLEKTKLRINKKVMNSSGTWIDWQHLFEAASLLARCRYTLQYTYPYAYYMEAGPRKELFEYQQAQLEAEIENLSWKIERAETTDRGDLENQMDIAEKRRITLLKDFLEV
ncbi:potential E3 ubiquitin-protein ligase ariadne-2 isoform X1 [Nasonia vitripennis]|uniref:RBR-type E3 ubiquitin transferase n=1 Tax=Nasonia vitripennis TaxID=7425 RepID=A0A7M7QMI3_NASVI|nr:potential E3 ubiquitin-protein ligase ariadne-2 isoform X1 [Nasonia vitripennis]